MLSEVNFVQESIAINLYYLRTLREFCLNIQTSLVPFEKGYISKAESIALSCERLGNDITSFASGMVSKEALDYQIYVTQYTLECEKLTEKLFNIDIDTGITEKELQLKSGEPKTVSQEMVDSMKRINAEAFSLADEFSKLCTEIVDKMEINELFSYSYIALTRFMIYETELFKSGLERLIQQFQIDPSSAANYEFYFNNSMRSIAIFIEKLVDPINEDIFDKAKWFENSFKDAEETYKTTSLTPDNQKALTEKETLLVKEFHNFMEECIKKLLAREAYFIIEPIFLDNMYTQINFFQYILNYNKKNQ